MKTISLKLAEFVSTRTNAAKRNLSGDMDVVYGLGLSGDDFDEFILAYAKQFDVDISSVDWDAYTSSEGIVFRELVGVMVDRIRGKKSDAPPPLRLSDLDEAIESKKLIVGK